MFSMLTTCEIGVEFQVMKKTQGFTMIELMVVLAIAALLIGMAGPSFVEFIQNSRITSATNHMISQINFARSEAVRLNQAVNIAKTSATANTLTAGWTIYSDGGSATGNSAYNAAEDRMLREFEGYGSRNINLKTNSTGNNWIAFASNGTLAESGNTVLIAVCDDRGVSKGRLITISLTGRTTVTKSDSATNPLTTCTP
ncbi:MAG: GspH/FimT family pseudopilin [Hahellaceae bacterium]|nr:GspH/FimT family pseudopilin [Hahellaceae bacterium]